MERAGKGAASLEKRYTAFKLQAHREVRMSKILAGLCTLLFIAVLTPSRVNADPIVVTSGFLSVTGAFAGPVYSFAGTNFAATGSGGDLGNTGPAVSCFVCTSGQSINTGSLFVGTSLGKGTVTINGSTFNNIFIAGQFGFSGSPVVVPVTLLSNITLTAPFTFSGTMIGCVESHLICQTQVFSTELIGSGVATIELQQFIDSLGNSTFAFRSVTYTFESAAIPEPTSMLFLMSGLAALGATKLKFIKAVQDLRPRRMHL
jgi:hypothetical protein